MKEYCPSCNTESNLYFRSKDYNRRVTKETFYHYRCPNCRLIFISPVPQNLGDYYPTEYHFIPENVDYLQANIEQEKYKIELIQRYKKQGRLLEIGPSLGTFSYLAKQSGFDVEAIEMDSKCSAFLNEVVGIPTINSADATCAIKPLPNFDVITLWHVIEHMPNPWITLEKISEKINPGGILILATPNPDAFQFRVLGRYWPHVDAPRHLMLIPIPLLIEKMSMVGLEVELVTTNDAGGVGWNTFGWQFFFANPCQFRKGKNALKILGKLVAEIAKPIETKEGNGCAYTIIFRKP